jgi:hypothetical protein
VRTVVNERDPVAMYWAALIEKIGETSHVTESRMQEHHKHTHLCHPDNSGWADYCINLSHYTQLLKSNILSTNSQYMGSVIGDKDLAPAQ